MRRLINRISREFLQRFVKSESGATAVEFSLVAFPFFMVMGCICETGVMLFTEYALQSGVQEAARQIRTGQAQTAGLSANAFKTKICDAAIIIVDCGSRVTVYVKPSGTFGSLKTVLPSYLNVGLKPDGTPNPTSYNCGTASQAAGVIATYDWNFTMPFMGFLADVSGGTMRRLHGTAIFQNEPFPATTTCS